MEQDTEVHTICELSRLYIRLDSVGAVSVYLASDEQFARWAQMVRDVLPTLPFCPIPLTLTPLGERTRSQVWTPERRLEFVKACQAQGMRFALVEPAPGDADDPATLPMVDGVMSSRGGRDGSPAMSSGEESERVWRGRDRKIAAG